MRNRIFTATAVSTTLLVAALSACSAKDQTVKTAPDKPTATAAPATTAAAKPKPSPTARVAAVGDSVTVTGQNGEKLTVTLKRWLKTVHSGNEFITPDVGKAWVAGQFEIRNVGTAVYEDSPDNCVQAADGAGQRFDAAFVDSITAGPGMPSSVKLPGGDKALGWIVFEAPKGSKITRVQFTPNSGFGDQTAQWAVR